MSEEKDSSYYNEMYSINEYYHSHYKDSIYWVHWTQVIKFLKSERNAKILEVGSGPGQLAEYLKDEGFTNYRGFDISEKAIELAKSKNLGYHFFVGDAKDPNCYKDYFDVVVCLEVLEHIKDDLKVIQNIPLGRKVVFSVPNFTNPSHVRWFVSERQIKSRYYKLLDISAIVRVGNIYMCRAVRDNFSPSIINRILKNREVFTTDSIRLRLKHKFNKLKTYFQD